jgi:TatD DNase family protein
MAQEIESSEPYFFDAHTHVQFSGFAADRAAVLARARDARVWLVNVGTQIDTSRAAVELASRAAEDGYLGIFAAIGLHPVHTSRSFHDAQELGGGEAATGFISRGEVFDVAAYRELALHKKTVAIGECGLDYFHFIEDAPREEQIRRQKSAFIAQIELSLEVKKPLMIHCRHAFADLIEILKKYKERFDSERKSPGAIHFFTGTPDDARALLDLGFSFTFGGAITFPPRKDKDKAGGASIVRGDYDEVVKLIPLDRILSETDAPYVAPVPYRGKRNEPAYIPEVVKKLAELKGVALEVMKARILENARRVFWI